MYNILRPYFSILPIPYNHSSIESPSQPMYNFSQPFVFTLPILYNLPFIESPAKPLYNVPRPFVLPCPYRHTLQTVFLSFIESQLMMTRVPPSLAQLISSHASVHHCTFLCWLYRVKILQLPLQSSGSLSTDADYKLFKSMSTSSLMVEL